MKTLYFDTFSGLSGNMILGALLDAGLNEQIWKKELAKLGLRNYDIQIKRVVKQHISSLHLDVIVKEKKTERHLSDIFSIIDKSNLSKTVQDRGKKIFDTLAQAEAKVHRCSKKEIHFHEVGAVDAIVDIVGTSLALELMNVKKIICSPIRLGFGTVTTEHGLLPVPAPATAELLTGIPTYAGDIEGELTTPTGAAIIKTICDSFQQQPPMKVESIGYGAGTKELPHSNCLRVLIGEQNDQETDQSLVLETDIDDMTPEKIGFAQERLLIEGALDVSVTPILMKKGRPGYRITVLSPILEREKLIKLLFQETSTIGVRAYAVNRWKLHREQRIVNTEYGPITVKIVQRGGQSSYSPEYEDCRRIALAKKIPIEKVYEKALLQCQTP